jgi:hypothetical protein
MSFFEGRLNNSQWVTLAINIITTIVYSVIIYKNTTSPKKFRMIVHICLAIILIILYYTIREFYLLKNDDKIIRENNDITWYNVLYFSFSAVNLFGVLIPPY